MLSTLEAKENYSFKYSMEQTSSSKGIIQILDMRFM